MKRLSLSHIPRVDYANHSAYGKLFGKPSLLLRVKALKRFLPELLRQIWLTVIMKPRSIYAFNVTEEETRRFPLLMPLVQDGIATLRLDDQEMTHIREGVGPYIDALQKHKYSIPAEQRAFRDKVLPLHPTKTTQIYNDISAILQRYGVIATAERYRGFPLVIRRIYVHITDPDDLDWRHRFVDIGLPDPKSVYMHFDSDIQRMKCLLYITSVTADNGPFCHVQGSNRIKKGFLEYVTRKANDKSGLDKWDPETRRKFSALPRIFQHKAEFGNDLSDEDPETKAMLACERQFTSDNGNLILFDTDSLHRGGMMKSGQRIMLQIEFEKSGSSKISDKGGGMMSM